MKIWRICFNMALLSGIKELVGATPQRVPILSNGTSKIFVCGPSPVTKFCPIWNKSSSNWSSATATRSRSNKLFVVRWFTAAAFWCKVNRPWISTKHFFSFSICCGMSQVGVSEKVKSALWRNVPNSSSDKFLTAEMFSNGYNFILSGRDPLTDQNRSSSRQDSPKR